MAPRRFQGDMRECLRDFAQKFPKEVIQTLLAEFCGVSEKTSGLWITGEQLPSGETQLRLKIFLHALDYRVSELDDLPRNLRELAQVISYRVESLTEVSYRLGYARSQDLLRVLRGDQRQPTEKKAKTDEIIKNSSARLSKTVASWKARLEEDLDIDLSKAPASASTSGKVGQQPVIAGDMSEEQMAEIVDHLIASLSMLLDNGNQSRVGPGGRKYPQPLPDRRRKPIVKRVSDDRLRRLSAQLGML